MNLIDLEEAREHEAKRRLKLLGDLASHELTEDELYDLLRNRAQTTLVPAKYLSRWRHTYFLEGLSGLRPDWAELDDDTESVVLDRYEMLGDLADAETVTPTDIAALANQLGWTYRRTKRWLRRYRIGGLWGLAPGKSPFKRAPSDSPPRDPATLDSAALEVIYERRSILGPLADKESVTNEEAEARAAETGVSTRTIWNYLSAYRQHGSAGLARRRRSDRGGYHGISDRMVEIVRGIRLSNRDWSARAVHEEACKKAHLLGEAAPSERQVRSICEDIPEPVLLIADGRQDEFRNRYRITYRMQFGNSQIVYQIDHTPIDVLVRDMRSERYRTKSGEVRPWLTLTMDSRSRLMMAAQFGYDRPDRFTVAAAIRDSLLTSKSKPYGGIPDEIWVDRGKELLANHVEQIASELGIRLFPGPPHQPQLRGRTERFFGTLNTRLWSTLPGYVASNTTERNPNARAELTISELVDEFWAFVERYHHEVHSETGETPIDYWNGHCFAPPVDPRRLDILLMERARRKVGKIGIRYKSREYWHDALASLVGESVLVRAGPSYAAPDEIEVFHDGHWVCTAFATDSERGRAVNRSDIRAAQRRQRQAARQMIDEAREALSDAEREIEEVTQKTKAPEPSQERSQQRDEDTKPEKSRPKDRDSDFLDSLAGIGTD